MLKSGEKLVRSFHEDTESAQSGRLLMINSQPPSFPQTGHSITAPRFGIGMTAMRDRPIIRLLRMHLARGISLALQILSVCEDRWQLMQ